MIDIHRSAGIVVLTIVTLCHITKPSLFAQEVLPHEKTQKRYQADVQAYSIIPGKGADTYRGYGTLGVSSGGTAETGMHSSTQRFQINAQGRMKAERFLVDFTVKDVASGQAKVVENLSRQLDLTDLKPEFFEVAQDPDGRVYRVSVIPRIVEMPAVRAFRAEDQKLEQWSFRGSAVIVDDRRYAGMMEMAGGNLATVEIPGLADIDFSLLPLKDSAGEGVLRDGKLMIRHEGTSVVITNVRNGVSGDTLSNGPYKVFVRWKPSKTSEAEMLEALKERLRQLRTESDKNDKFAEEAMTALQKAIDSKHPGYLGCGISNVRPGDIDRTLLKADGDKSKASGF